MKYLFFVILSFSSFYSLAEADFNPKDGKTIFQHLNNGGEVSTKDIIMFSINFSEDLCDNQKYQAEGGYTVESCHDKLKSLELACTDEIFDDQDKTYTSKNEVGALFKQFNRCVGT